MLDKSTTLQESELKKNMYSINSYFGNLNPTDYLIKYITLVYIVCCIHSFFVTL